MNCTCFFRACLAHPAAEHPTERAAATKELSKQVFSIHAGAGAALFKPLFAILII
jgi:hypothetical protein